MPVETPPQDKAISSTGNKMPTIPMSNSRPELTSISSPTDLSPTMAQLPQTPISLSPQTTAKFKITEKLTAVVVQQLLIFSTQIQITAFCAIITRLPPTIISSLTPPS